MSSKANKANKVKKPNLGIKMSVKPTVTKSSKKMSTVYVECKTKGLIYHVTAPKDVDMNDLGNNLCKAITNGGILVTPENVVINIVHNK